jgi:hypothetical protein
MYIMVDRMPSHELMNSCAFFSSPELQQQQAVQAVPPEDERVEDNQNSDDDEKMMYALNLIILAVGYLQRFDIFIFPINSGDSVEDFVTPVLTLLYNPGGSANPLRRCVNRLVEFRVPARHVHTQNKQVISVSCTSFSKQMRLLTKFFQTSSPSAGGCSSSLGNRCVY